MVWKRDGISDVGVIVKEELCRKAVELVMWELL